MIEIFPATKLKINTVVRDSGDQLLVCVRDAKGRLVFITELAKYLEGLGEDEEQGSGNWVKLG